MLDNVVAQLTTARLLQQPDPLEALPEMIVAIASKLDLDVLDLAYAANSSVDLNLCSWKFLSWMVETVLERYADATTRTKCGDAVKVLRDKSLGRRVSQRRAYAAASTTSASAAAYAAASAASAASAAAASTTSASAAAYAAACAYTAYTASTSYAASYAASAANFKIEMREKLLQLVSGE